jgi:two-component sensor histidine kinase
VLTGRCQLIILNETAMNSIKHAFGPKGGQIKVRLVGGIGYGEARLTVSDNGCGVQNSNEHGSGLKLIASLARQIGHLRRSVRLRSPTRSSKPGPSLSAKP